MVWWVKKVGRLDGILWMGRGRVPHSYFLERLRFLLDFFFDTTFVSL